MTELDRLRRTLAGALESSLEPAAVPKSLEREIAELRKHLDGGGTPAENVDRARRALTRFWQSGRLESLQDARLLAFSLGAKLLLDRPAVLRDATAFVSFLTQMDAFATKPRPLRRVYRGMVFAYFDFDPVVQGGSGDGATNWQSLRTYLEQRFKSIRTPDAYEPLWVGTLADHRGLLTEQPTKRYAAAALRGDTSEFGHVVEALEISEASWFVRDFVLAQVAEATSLSDDEFKNHVSGLLEQFVAHELVRDEGLAMLIDRYAAATEREEHAALKNASIDAWGNPLVNANQAKWGRVSAPGQEMISTWLKLDLIEHFFEVLAYDRQTDRRRVEFWKRYHAQMDGMYFALGSRASDSRDTDIARLRKKMGDLRLSLVSGGGAANNAFIMQMGDFVIVEFGLKGNACFVFRRNELPFELRGYVAGDRSGLKSRSHLHRFLHIDKSYGTWESEVEGALARLGIRPEAKKAGRKKVPGTRRPARSKRVPLAGAPSTVAKQQGFSQKHLKAFAQEHGLTLDDRSDKGGSLWVFGAPASGSVANQLIRWGFRHAAHKDGWWRS